MSNAGILSLTDPALELTDPNPNIHKLFRAFNDLFFESSLDVVSLRYSKTMTVCAGICRYKNKKCTISLSEPILKLRPRSDLVNTLIHEMIHAYIFLNVPGAIYEEHGPTFKHFMNTINQHAGTQITIYHTFNNEVLSLKTHWWQCNGPCQYRPPYYGIVKRSMNRAPGPADFWWAAHKSGCDGDFLKIRSPEKKMKGLKSDSTQPSIKAFTNSISSDSAETKREQGLYQKNTTRQGFILPVVISEENRIRSNEFDKGCASTMNNYIEISDSDSFEIFFDNH